MTDQREKEKQHSWLFIAVGILCLSVCMFGVLSLFFFFLETILIQEHIYEASLGSSFTSP